MAMWLARGAWVALVLTVGEAVDRATSAWSTAPRVVVATLLLAAWGVGALALLTPRPRSITALRVVTTGIVGASVIAAVADGGALAIVAGAHAIVAAALVLGPNVNDRCTDGASYGNERRVPLRLPPHFAVVVVPLAAALVCAGVAAGPLLLADRRWVPGAIALGVGAPVVVAALRSLATLERRFIVLVPAGLVIADALVLVDPVLFPREHVLAVRPADDADRGAPDAVGGSIDLRLGARDALELFTDEPAPVPCRDGRSGTRTIDTLRVVFAPLDCALLLREWDAREPRNSASRPRPGR